MKEFLFFIGDKKILTLMAVSAEYGSALSSLGIKPYFIGVGPIQAAVHTTAFLSQMSLAGCLPDIVFNIGSAGSSTLKQAEIYQVHSITYRDIDASPFGFAKGETPFSNHPITLVPELSIHGLDKASLSTGANVITIDGQTGTSFADLTEDMVDMESYAVMTATRKFNIPYLGLRGISDGDSCIEGKMTWEAYLHVIDEKLSSIYKKIQKNPNILHYTSAPISEAV